MKKVQNKKKELELIAYSIQYISIFLRDRKVNLPILLLFSVKITYKYKSIGYSKIPCIQNPNCDTNINNNI